MKWFLEVVATLAITAVSLYAFYLLAQDTSNFETVDRLDTSISDFFQPWHRPWLDAIMKFFTYAGGTIGVTTFTFMLVFRMIDLGRMSDARFTTFLIIGGTILANGLKPFLKRERPNDALKIKKPRSSSFPSGHSMASMCFALAGIEVALTSPSFPFWVILISCAAYIAYAVIVGLSRVYLGVHWVSDVVGSWLLGAAWIAACTGVQRLLIHGLFS